MDKGLITQLQILKLSNIKPNFSELARQYDLDRRTVKRYYDGYEGKPKHHNKPSKLDEHYVLVKLFGNTLFGKSHTISNFHWC